MKKWLAILLGWMLIFSAIGGAAAETVYTGQIVAGDVIELTVPFSGTVEKTEKEVGELVRAGDELFQLSTSRVYAPCAGTVQGILAEEGDHLADTSRFYQGALYLEPEAAYLIYATTDGSAGETENKLLHVGETVYLRRNSDSNRRTGTGVVTAVSGKQYTVEVRSGDLELNDTCYIYRDDSYESDQRVGRGTISRNDPIAISGTGVLLKLHVQNGQTVCKGDMLMETVPDLAWGDDSSIAAPADGILAVSNVSVGSAVNQGQLAAVLWPLDGLEACVSVDEYDLPGFEIGQRYVLTLDCDTSRRYEATVSQIDYLPVQGTGKTCYEVRFAFTVDDIIRPGLSVTLSPAAY